MSLSSGSTGFDIPRLSQWASKRKVTVDISSSDPFVDGYLEDIPYLIGNQNGRRSWQNPQFSEISTTLGPNTTVDNVFRMFNRYWDLSWFSVFTSPPTGSYASFSLDFDADQQGRLVNFDGFFLRGAQFSSSPSSIPFFVYAGTGDSVATANWVVVAGFSASGFFPAGFRDSWSNFKSLSKQPEPYRFLRFQATGADQDNNARFTISQLHFGGDYHFGKRGY